MACLTSLVFGIFLLRRPSKVEKTLNLRELDDLGPAECGNVARGNFERFPECIGTCEPEGWPVIGFCKDSERLQEPILEESVRNELSGDISGGPSLESL